MSLIPIVPIQINFSKKKREASNEANFSFFVSVDKSILVLFLI